MAVMLEVLNGSSGRSAATGDKFPNHVLTGRYASGFTNSLMAKDVQLYLDAVRVGRGALALGGVRALAPAERQFIEHWEAEAYRRGLDAQ